MKICLVEYLSNYKGRLYTLCGDWQELGGTGLIAFLPQFADCEDCLKEFSKRSP